MTELAGPTPDPDGATAQPAIVYRLRLYISGATPRSLQAVRNIKMIGERYFADHYELEVIDVYQQADLMKDQNITALPTLLKYFPPPVRRIIGDLSDTQRVLRGLGLGSVG